MALSDFPMEFVSGQVKCRAIVGLELNCKSQLAKRNELFQKKKGKRENNNSVLDGTGCHCSTMQHLSLGEHSE